MVEPKTPVQYKKSFYAIGTREERVADVEFFCGFSGASRGANFTKMDRQAECALIVVYSSLSAARDALPSIHHKQGKEVEVIAL